MTRPAPAADAAGSTTVAGVSSAAAM
jgi:hypothetical protein